ncbi:hypothetical protein ACFQS6_06090 [Xanthomonas populi]|uniref:Uncharacterized protein n=1 Tax=Xanthomonas populi TaxID=53414 RepID=A0A2S7E5L6_9XANT|nr:hypothetical protein [Xanthomonas populi]PPU85021.1 hypothetical protein XpopCFBP1817_19985 [Xanthomonas populi]
MIESYRIERESEADAYLSDLLAKEEYRSMLEVEHRANKFIPDDDELRSYFINKAREILVA